MANVLLVGTVTLDIVYRLERYPQEDAEVRAQSLRVSRGGNAANTAVVLSQLGHRCTFLGVMADAPETAVIEQDFRRFNVDFSSCPRMPGRPPTSSIYLTGAARTIVHYRDLPELTAQQFAALDIAAFDWLHFEGRNVPELQQMLRRVKQLRPDTTLSLELEKPREGIAAVLQLPDVLICSRGYAQHCGQQTPEGFLQWLRQQHPGNTGVTAWGEAGAYGYAADVPLCHSPAFPPQSGVLDTLGAGDTFNAALIGTLANHENLERALNFACKLAGAKCGTEGLDLRASKLF